MKDAAPKFDKEVDLCAAFLAVVPAERWTAYAETQGWDILLVRRRDGVQIGIEAKLRLNVDVINQTIDQYGWWEVDRAGPDYRAVLVPGTHAGFGRICDHIGITIISLESASFARARYQKFSPRLPGEQYWNEKDWHEWMPVKRYDLPEFVPDVAAGASAPVQLTDWKIRALRLLATLAIRGYVTRHDFRHLGLDHRRWLTPGARWVNPEAGGRYVKGEFCPRFVEQHPKVYAELVATADDWILKKLPGAEGGGKDDLFLPRP